MNFIKTEEPLYFPRTKLQNHDRILRLLLLDSSNRRAGIFLVWCVVSGGSGASVDDVTTPILLITVRSVDTAPLRGSVLDYQEYQYQYDDRLIWEKEE